MTHKIKSVKPLKNCIISAVFYDGTIKEYNIRNLYAIFPQFKIFDTDQELFNNVQVDAGGYGVSWNDNLDLDANDIWEDGQEVGKESISDINLMLAQHLTETREKAQMTQKQLSEKTGIYQADISKIERGIGNPSLSTLKRLADGMETTLKIEFVTKNATKN